MNYPTTFSQQELLLVDDHVQTIAKRSLKWVEREIDVHLDMTIDGKKARELISYFDLINKQVPVVDHMEEKYSYAHYLSYQLLSLAY